MPLPVSAGYVESKACVIRATDKITAMITAAGEFKADSKNTAKWAKIEQMLRDFNDIRCKFKEDIQYMDNAVSLGTTPIDVKDTSGSRTLSFTFDNLYYELAAFAEGQKISLSPVLDQSLSATLNKTINNVSNNVSHYQLQKRTFPIFSGIITEWQGFDDLFNSIM